MYASLGFIVEVIYGSYLVNDLFHVMFFFYLFKDDINDIPNASPLWGTIDMKPNHVYLHSHPFKQKDNTKTKFKDKF